MNLSTYVDIARGFREAMGQIDGALKQLAAVKHDELPDIKRRELETDRESLEWVRAELRKIYFGE
jgi:hypothetical protein